MSSRSGWRERGVSTAWGASSRHGRDVTAAWNRHFVLVEALGLILVEVPFWLVVSLSTVSRNNANL